MVGHMVIPSFEHSDRFNVYACIDGVLVYAGQVWEGEYNIECDPYEPDLNPHIDLGKGPTRTTINYGPGWFAKPKGWPDEVQPDHFGPHCTHGSKGTAIRRCLTATRRDS